jgi:peptidoglycan hydrolase-like protein with peptidoglycan-binding domain
MSGNLRVNVFGPTAARPVARATVRLFEQQIDGSAGSIIDEIYTDSSGVSEEISLASPPWEYSQDPNFPKPYSEYVVRVSAYGFETVEISGVEIFEDAHAIQNIFMPYSAGIEEKDVHIGPHTLWYEYPPKIPEDAVKELPDETGFIVLPEPVVPEFIVVHYGDPNWAGAPQYWVPFADYIKNVASSEVYSTWPTETIKANVLAILSFTLNRVFTEWYRNKGKNFTITSSTQYDQAFMYQRNIFENISDIVDEIFTTYITKPGIRQPLFAQYCDGNRTSCPGWMSQWGSKRMGDEGYSAFEILRHYYGSDIYLTQAEKVAGVPSSFPGYVLDIGSSGSYVLTIQQQINAISNNFPAIAKVVDDGIFGPKTQASVRKFQQVFRMPQSGVVDFATWYRISEIYVAVTRMAELR